VAGERIYMLSSKGMEDEFVLALSVQDGKRLWSTRLGKVGPNQGPNYPGSRSTPTIDGDQLYALGSDGDLACLDVASGKVRWQKSFRTEFGGKAGYWAFAESPLIDGDMLICTPGGSDATIVALNKETGATIWKCAVPGGDRAAYASIIAADAGGRKQYIQFVSKGVVGVDAKTGQFLWRYDQTGKNPANITTPVAHDGYVYSGGGRIGMGGLIRLKAQNDGVVAEPVYFERGLPTSIGGAVEFGGYLYGTNPRGLVCADFVTGKIKWQDKCVGQASICCADGRLYVHGENGAMALVDATPDGYHERGRFTPPEQPKHLRGVLAWAYPAVADGRLYFRDQNVLWCYDVRDTDNSR
jgi:outer membrane protein assembly factor BamB